jgi:hypothetical protein
VCTYDYDRAEVRFEETSSLARPYVWVPASELHLDTWYTRNGMSALVAWLLAVARLAKEHEQRHVIFTNHLYHETDMLFDMARLNGLDVRRHASVEELLVSAARESDPAVVFLDSSRPDGGSEALRRVLRCSDPERIGCVVWDNTCVPVADHPFDAQFTPSDLGPSLVVIRSHVKLDQLGLEFSSLGSVALLVSRGAPRASHRWRDAMQSFIPDAITVSGACASPTTLRLFAALGVPNLELTARSNACLHRANVLGGAILADRLSPTGRYRVEQSDHRCFVEIHLDELAAPMSIGGPPTWPPWDDLDQELTAIEQRAALRSIPIWKSASFGFHYTGLSWYGSEQPPLPHGHAHTVLRVCFGMHDPEVTSQVAEIIAEQLRLVEDWPVPA